MTQKIIFPVEKIENNQIFMFRQIFNDNIYTMQIIKITTKFIKFEILENNQIIQIKKNIFERKFAFLRLFVKQK